LRFRSAQSGAVRSAGVLGAALTTFAIATLLTSAWRLAPPPAAAAVPTRGDPFDLELVVSGLRRPVFVLAVPDDSGGLLVAEQDGTIRMVTDGRVESVPLLDLRDEVQATGSEQGLLSFAFHPGYEQNGRMFVAFTARPDGRLVVDEFLVANADHGLVATRTRGVFEASKPTAPTGEPFEVHNGGQLRFGPRDGYLYIGLGDGTEPKYTDLTSQDLASVWGSILRIDVDDDPAYAIPASNPFVGRPGVRGEIFAYGLRNPWRFSFDPDGATIWVSDVGQSRYEEIDRVVAGKNYGWPHREGFMASLRANLHAAGFYRTESGRPRFVVSAVFDYLLTSFRNLEPPVVHYAHPHIDPAGGNAAVGGFVYQGERIPALRGRYLFGDFVSGRLWSIAAEPSAPFDWRAHAVPWSMISAIEPDADGEPIVADYASGTLYRLRPIDSGTR